MYVCVNEVLFWYSRIEMYLGLKSEPLPTYNQYAADQFENMLEKNTKPLEMKV